MTLNDYRLYFLSAEELVLRAQDLECEDDSAAIEAARVLDHAAAIEIWCGNRRVGRVATG